MLTLNLAGVFQRWQKRKATRRALYALSNDQLLDIGIIRSEVEYVVAGQMPRGHRYSH
jgi:uncharacterized protein YjiS (DUF1127 family)